VVAALQACLLHQAVPCTARPLAFSRPRSITDSEALKGTEAKGTEFPWMSAARLHYYSIILCSRVTPSNSFGLHSSINSEPWRIGRRLWLRRTQIPLSPCSSGVVRVWQGFPGHGVPSSILLVVSSKIRNLEYSTCQYSAVQVFS
jgi:hypothetical protein